MVGIKNEKIPSLNEQYSLKEKASSADTKPAEDTMPAVALTSNGLPPALENNEVADKTSDLNQNGVKNGSEGEKQEVTMEIDEEGTSTWTIPSEDGGTPEVVRFNNAPYDSRFPNPNQSRKCFAHYVEYHRCLQAKGEDSPDCVKYQRWYSAICPEEWTDRWDDQRERGVFPLKI